MLRYMPLLNCLKMHMLWSLFSAHTHLQVNFSAFMYISFLDCGDQLPQEAKKLSYITSSSQLDSSLAISSRGGKTFGSKCSPVLSVCKTGGCRAESSESGSTMRRILQLGETCEQNEQRQRCEERLKAPLLVLDLPRTSHTKQDALCNL